MSRRFRLLNIGLHRKYRVGTGLLVLAIIATIVWIVFDPLHDRAETIAVGGDASVTLPVAAPAQASAQAEAPTPRRPSLPLPPVQAPLNDIADELQQRAEAGDSAAACRLGIELVRCRRLMQFGRDYNPADSWRDSALEFEDQGQAREAERMQALADRFVPIGEACRRVPEQLLARGPEFLRAAALAGEPEALLRQSSGNDLYPGGAFGMSTWLSSPEFDRWRTEAPQFLRQALAAGRPEAVLLYADGYGGGNGAVQGLLVDDPQQAAAWRALARRMFGADADSLLQPLTVLPGHVDAAAADAQAARWHDDYFAGARYTAADLLERSLFGVDNPSFFDESPGLAGGSACGGGLP